MDDTQKTPVLQPPKPPRQSHGTNFFSGIVQVVKGIASIFSSIVKVLFAIVAIVFLVSLITELSSADEEATTTYQEVLYGTGPEIVAVIDLHGMILDVVPQGPFDYVTEAQLITPRRVLKLLEDIKSDPNIKAVVLRINSPGGSATASDEIYQIIKRFRVESGIPVIVSQGEIAASGGYYISLAGDTIVSDPTTLTGSIGVIASMLNFQELANEYGVKEIAVTSGENKNFFSPFQEMSEEERTILQRIIDENYAQFLSRVRESRPTSESQLTELADGRPLTGKQAYDAQLVDKLGNFYDSVELARQKAGFPHALVIEYTDQGIFESLFGVVSRPIMNKLPFSLVDPYAELRGKPAYLYGGM
ncbi:signal peptide peptidase SppA [Candidatus Roizmanbacteria bacterium]|nr:signal peptide peptidase SppA [Candidatus Roizmanbacteria bacterium]